MQNIHKVYSILSTNWNEWMPIRKCSGLCFITRIQRKKGKITDFEIPLIIHNLHQRLCQSPGSKTAPCLSLSHHPMILTCISLLAKKQAKKWSSKRKKFIMTSFSSFPKGEKGFTEVLMPAQDVQESCSSLWMPDSSHWANMPFLKDAEQKANVGRSCKIMQALNSLTWQT